MPNPGGLPKILSEAVESYVDRCGSDRPVSMKRLVKATSFMMPELGLTGKELSDLIATKLVALGCNINFDMSEGAVPLPDEGKRSRHIQSRPPIDHGTPRSARERKSSGRHR